MKGLTVRNPAAWAIVHGGKNVENRTRPMGSYRGALAIIAGLQPLTAGHPFWNLDAYRDAFSRANEHDRDRLDVRGAIIGVVDLVDAHRHYRTGNGCLAGVSHTRAEVCSPWAERDAHHLVLANPRPVPEPIAYKGFLGLRTIDEETTARVLEAIT